MSITISSNARIAGGLFQSMNSLSGGMFAGFDMMGGYSLSEYSSIRNGSYKKLLNSYYSSAGVDTGRKTSTTEKPDSVESKPRVYNYWTPDGMIQRTYSDGKTSSKTPSSTAVSKDQVTKLAALESSAEKLANSADVLLTQGANSLFKQTTASDKGESQTSGYNVDAIYKAVNSYVDNYNALIKNAGESNVVAIRSSAASIMDYSKNNKSLLASAGITVDAEKKTLSINEKAFKEADMDTVKKLFQGTGSYGYQVSARADAIDRSAQYEAFKANTYNGGGKYSYNYSSGSLWNSMI